MILVTGGTGFIGGHLVDALSAAGEPFRCLVRRDARLPAHAEAVRGDLVTGAGLSEALPGVDTVLHLAGVTKALSIRDYYAGNARASENLANAIKASGRPIRMLCVSSLSAMGPSLDGMPVSEDAEPHPVCHYGKSKLEGERIVRERLPDSVIVRPAVVYGPRDTDVFQLFKSINQGLAVEIAGGERWAQAIYVKDLVEGILVAARSQNAAGRAYFLAHSKPVSWTELRVIASSIMHQQPRVIRIPVALAFAVGAAADLWSRITRKSGIISLDKVSEAVYSHWTCETARAARELGFEARTGLAEGVAASLAWYKEAGWLKY